MRILVVSNLYPPHYIGGYELGCKDVVDGLRTRGHQVEVLASTYGIGKADHSDGIRRWLFESLNRKIDRSLPCFFNLLRQEIHNQAVFKRSCKEFIPDIVYFWNLYRVSVSLAFTAQRLVFPVSYFVFDNWLSEWESDPWYSQIHRQPLRFHNRLAWKCLYFFLDAAGLVPPLHPLNLQHAQFATRYLKDAALKRGKLVNGARIIHWGIRIMEAYPYRDTFRRPKRLLYVGQITPHKGLDTAVKALKILIEKFGYTGVTLTIVGKGSADSEMRIRHLIQSLGLQSNVLLKGFVSREDLPPIYRDHDVLIFPSVWDEPFGITLLEGMASGLAVVTTATGGSGEIVEDEVNGLVYPKGEATECAAQIARLIQNEELYEQIRKNGRRSVERKFRFDWTLDEIEASLYEVLKSGESPRLDRDSSSISHAQASNTFSVQDVAVQARRSNGPK